MQSKEKDVMIFEACVLHQGDESKNCILTFVETPPTKRQVTIAYRKAQAFSREQEIELEQMSGGRISFWRVLTTRSDPGQTRANADNAMRDEVKTDDDTKAMIDDILAKEVAASNPGEAKTEKPQKSEQIKYIPLDPATAISDLFGARTTRYLVMHSRVLPMQGVRCVLGRIIWYSGTEHRGLDVKCFLWQVKTKKWIPVPAPIAVKMSDIYGTVNRLPCTREEWDSITVQLP